MFLRAFSSSSHVVLHGNRYNIVIIRNRIYLNKPFEFRFGKHISKEKRITQNQNHEIFKNITILINKKETHPLANSLELWWIKQKTLYYILVKYSVRLVMETIISFVAECLFVYIRNVPPHCIRSCISPTAANYISIINLIKSCRLKNFLVIIST